MVVKMPVIQKKLVRGSQMHNDIDRLDEHIMCLISTCGCKNAYQVWSTMNIFIIEIFYMKQV